MQNYFFRASNSHTPWIAFRPAQNVAGLTHLATIKIVYKDFIMPKTKLYQTVGNLSLGRTNKCKYDITKGLRKHGYFQLE